MWRSKFEELEYDFRVTSNNLDVSLFVCLSVCVSLSVRLCLWNLYVSYNLPH